MDTWSRHFWRLGVLKAHFLQKMFYYKVTCVSCFTVLKDLALSHALKAFIDPRLSFPLLIISFFNNTRRGNPSENKSLKIVSGLICESWDTSHALVKFQVNWGWTAGRCNDGCLEQEKSHSPLPPHQSLIRNCWSEVKVIKSWINKCRSEHQTIFQQKSKWERFEQFYYLLYITHCLHYFFFKKHNTHAQSALNTKFI